MTGLVAEPVEATMSFHFDKLNDHGKLNDHDKLNDRLVAEPAEAQREGWNGKPAKAKAHNVYTELHPVIFIFRPFRA